MSIPSKDADIAILEEPEHLNWYHHGKSWTDRFNHVVGIVHTNYLEYIKREKNEALQAFLVKHINHWVTRAYCHKRPWNFSTGTYLKTYTGHVNSRYYLNITVYTRGNCRKGKWYRS